MQSEARQYTETSQFGAKKVYCRTINPALPKGAPKGFKGEVTEGWQGDQRCCKLPGVRIVGSCSCPRRSGHDVPKPSIRQVLVCILQLLSLLDGQVLHP